MTASKISSKWSQETREQRKALAGTKQLELLLKIIHGMKREPRK